MLLSGAILQVIPRLLSLGKWIPEDIWTAGLECSIWVLVTGTRNFTTDFIVDLICGASLRDFIGFRFVMCPVGIRPVLDGHDGFCVGMRHQHIYQKSS